MSIHTSITDKVRQEIADAGPELLLLFSFSCGAEIAKNEDAFKEREAQLVDVLKLIYEAAKPHETFWVMLKALSQNGE